MPKKLSREEYGQLVEQAPMMIWRSDVTMACDYFNQRWLAFTGRTLAQEVGDGWAQGVHPDDLAVCVNTYKSHFAARKAFEMEYRLRRFDGVYHWIVDRGAPISDARGQFRGYIGSCVDVMDKRMAREALQRAQEMEILQLRGLLPVCVHCKRVRVDEDYWQQIEIYIGNHSQALIEPMLCPECSDKVAGKKRRPPRKPT